MNKRIAKIVGWALLGVFVLVCVLYSLPEPTKRTNKEYRQVYKDIFVTERDGVYALYEALGDAVAHPDEAHYAAALKAAEDAEEICLHTFGKVQLDFYPEVAIYGAGHTYYATFYRDVKARLRNGCEPEVLGQMRVVFQDILTLYDAPAEPSKTREIISAIDQFYYGLTTLGDKLTQFV